MGGGAYSRERKKRDNESGTTKNKPKSGTASSYQKKGTTSRKKGFDEIYYKVK